MSSHAVTYYVAKCDDCGRLADADDYGGEHSAWSDHGTASEMLSDDWFKTGATDICPSCKECEVCKSATCYEVDEHLVCEEHEDHEFADGAS